MAVSSKPGPSLVAARRDSSGPESWGSRRWHADGARRFPRRDQFDDLSALFRELGDGYRPSVPLLGVGDTVVTIGSCFASHIREVLTRVGFSSGSVWVPSGLNNTFAILDFVSWCIDGRQTASGYRYDLDDEGGIIEWQPDEERISYRPYFADAGALIFTIGLAEVWQDRATGEVFWRGVPEHVFDAERHQFRLSSVDENVSNLRQIVEVVRRANENAPIIFTLSPVPLSATFRPIACMTADCVSKSILRVALDQVDSSGMPSVYYWPSFEMVRWTGGHLDQATYAEPSKPGNSMRHPADFVVDHVVDAFVEAFYTPQTHALFREREQQGRQRVVEGSI